MFIEQARGIARGQLPKEAINDQQYGVGFVIVHEGAAGDYVFVDWWWANDIVQHHLFGAKKGGAFESISSPIACPPGLVVAG